MNNNTHTLLDTTSAKTVDMSFKEIQDIIEESETIFIMPDGFSSLIKHPKYGYLNACQCDGVSITNVTEDKANAMMMDRDLTKMWLQTHCEIRSSNIQWDSSDVYYTKVGGYYVTRVGMENTVQRYAALNLQPVIISGKPEGSTFCVGLSKTDGKYYGWSHRAMYGFGVGSRITEDSCGYKPHDLNMLIKKTNDFWKDEHSVNVNTVVAPLSYHPDVTAEFLNEIEGQGFRTDYMLMTTWLYAKSVPNKDLRNNVEGSFTFVPRKFNGSRKYAKTAEQALQMAINFAKESS